MLRLRKVGEAIRFGEVEPMLRWGVVATIEHSHLGNLPISLVIDVGANRGQFSMLMRRHRSGVPIRAFEPLEEARRVLERNIDGDIQVFPYALGEYEHKANFNISGSDASSSLLEITPLQARLFPGTQRVSSSEVDVRRLDSFSFDLPAEGTLVKIDTQGTELGVISGGAGVIDAASWVYVECSYVELYRGQATAGDVVERMLARDFQLSGVYNTQFDANGRAIQSDLLFGRA